MVLKEGFWLFGEFSANGITSISPATTNQPATVPKLIAHHERSFSKCEAATPSSKAVRTEAKPRMTNLEDGKADQGPKCRDSIFPATARNQIAPIVKVRKYGLEVIRTVILPELRQHQAESLCLA